MSRLYISLQLAFITILLGIASCTPDITPTLTSNTVIALPTLTVRRETNHLTPTLIPPTLIEPTPIQLPFNDRNVENKYCKTPAVNLPILETDGLTEDEIAKKLMAFYLDYFNRPEAPDFCRIDGYRIEGVDYDERWISSSLSPKGDFMRGVQYSIKLIQIPNYWMSHSGEIDQQNWFHISNILAVFKLEIDGVYTMKFANP